MGAEVAVGDGGLADGVAAGAAHLQGHLERAGGGWGAYNDAVRAYERDGGESGDARPTYGLGGQKAVHARNVGDCVKAQGRVAQDAGGEERDAGVPKAAIEKAVAFVYGVLDVAVGDGLRPSAVGPIPRKLSLELRYGRRSKGLHVSSTTRHGPGLLPVLLRALMMQFVADP